MNKEKTAYEYYMEDLQKYKSNTPEENETLEKMYKEGDLKAREKLVNGNLRLVLFVVNQYTDAPVDRLDLIQQGNLGLLEAIESYDPDRGSLSTYIVLQAKRYINRYLYDQSRTIRKPEWQQTTSQKIYDFIAEHKRQFSETPTVETIAAGLNLAEITVERIMKDNSFKFVPLDAPIGDGVDTVQDIIPDTTEQDASDSYKKAIQTALHYLNQEDRELLEYIYGLNGRPQKTMEEIGKMRNMTKQGISLQHIKALTKLRHPKILNDIRRQL